jgi:hypothetical protein
MAQVKTDLEGINGAGIYTVFVDFVSRDPASIEKIETLPAIVMVEGNEIEERTASNERLFLMAQLTLVVLFRVGDDAAATTVNAWLRDIKLAMIGTTNFRHGGWCHRTVYRGMDPLGISGADIAGAAINFALHYDHTWTDP